MVDSQATNLSEAHLQEAESLHANSNQKLRVGGFPEEIFEDLYDNEKESLFCNICLNLVNQCQRCSNSHLFCKSCIFVWTQVPSFNAKKCPVCRAPQSEYLSVSEADQRLMNKEVSCPVENCSFKSSLKLFLLHAHGKSMYCNEQKDYDKFKDESRRSNNERLIRENERYAELINFIERFNIVQSLLSFESLLGNDRSITLLNMLHDIVGMTNRRDSLGSGMSQAPWDISLPVGLVNSIERPSTNLASSNDQPRLASSSTSPLPISTGGMNNDSHNLSIDEAPDNLSLSTQGSSLLDSLPESSRMSDSSSLSSLSTDDGSFDLNAFYRAVSSHLESESSEEDDDDYPAISVKRPQVGAVQHDFAEEFLASSASTDTLVDNHGVKDDKVVRNIDGNRMGRGTLSNGLGSPIEKTESIQPATPLKRFLDSSDSSLQMNEDSLYGLPAPDGLSIGAPLVPNRNRFLPSRVSGLPLMASKDVSRSATNRDMVTTMPSCSCPKANIFNSPMLKKEASSSSGKISLVQERPVRSFKPDKYKFTYAAPAEPTTRKQSENMTFSRSKLSKTILNSSKDISCSSNDTRISRYANDNKLGETSKKCSFSKESFRLPSIYTATSSRAPQSNSSMLPKVAPEPSDPPKGKKGFLKTSLSILRKKK